MSAMQPESGSSPVGSIVLRIPAIRSPNYVAGASGWTINQDGTAEFNSGSFRVSIEVGSDPGQHFIVNNSATGDIIDVYDASNNLVMKIDNTGAMTVLSYTGTTLDQHTEFGQQGLIFSDDHDASMGIFEFSGSAGSLSLPAFVTLQVDNNAAPSHIYTLQAFAGSDDGSFKPTLLGSERGVTGSMVQSDGTSTNNLFHMGSYSVTTNVSGIGTFAHGCGFTPTGGVATANAVTAAGATQFSFQTGAWTNTNATVAVKTPTGAIYTGTATFYAAFCG